MFVYNENGCKAIIEFETKQISRLLSDSSFLESERDGASELMVRFAIEEALAKVQFEIAKRKIRIREMEQHLKDATVNQRK